MVAALGMPGRLSLLEVRSCGHGLRVEARLADSLKGQGVRAFCCIDLQRAGTELEAQRADPFQRLQRAADFRLLGAAVHGRNSEHLTLARAACGGIDQGGGTGVSR